MYGDKRGKALVLTPLSRYSESRQIRRSPELSSSRRLEKDLVTRARRQLAPAGQRCPFSADCDFRVGNQTA